VTRAERVQSLVPPPPHTAGSFPVLDTLRAVGALCVLTTHVSFWAGDYTRHGALGTLLARLDVGVAIFFVLSGFLLSRAWLTRAADGLPRPATRPYFWNRALRVLPLYVVSVVLALTLIEQNAGLGVRDWASALLLLDTFRSEVFPAGLTQMWSLSVEVSFYLVLPLLMWALLGRSGRLRPTRVLAGLATMVVVSMWWHVDGASHVGTGRPLEWLPAYLTWFAAGILLALVEVLHSRGTRAALTQPLVALGRQPGSCWALAVALMLICATPLAGPTMFAAPTTAESLTKHILYALVGFLVVLTGIFAEPDSLYSRAFTHPVGRRLGWISYGIFCLHLLVLHLVMWATGWTLFAGRGPAIWILAVLGSIVAAEIAYRLLERPALRLKVLVSGPELATSSPVNGTTIT
jgi:peptidoglycan/LPS O-acetylase OafA/YrhL